MASDRNEAQVKTLITQKLEISAKIKELHAQMGKVNVELARAGGNVAEIGNW